MCVRFDKVTGEEIRWSRDMKAWIPLADWVMGLDTFPGYKAPIVVPDWSTKALRMVVQDAAWGLQPHWAKDGKFGQKNAYNARSETVFEKPTFRTAVKKRRCVVPASAFYERADGRWLKVSRTDDLDFAVAGLWEEPNDWTDGLPTFTLVTTEPNETIVHAHDRMPVILAPEDVPRWMDLDTPADELRALMIPCPSEWVKIEDAGPVSRKKPQSDEPPGLF